MERALTGCAAREAETLLLAFMVLLQRLSPVERAAYLLHKVFEHSHSEVAEILGKETAACRQLYHRAEQHLASGQLRFAPSQEEHSRLLLAFLQALGQGDLAGLRALLSADAVAWSDGGGKARAALKPTTAVMPWRACLWGLRASRRAWCYRPRWPRSTAGPL